MNRRPRRHENNLRVFVPSWSPSSYCTFALTDAFADSVNVHVLRLLPELEQAPDQIASRPFDTLNVIDVPPANEAVPVLPTLTLMPAGDDVMRSPLRPVAVTVRVADDGGGVVAPCGVKRRAVENAPHVPAELRARTRHHSVADDSPLDSVVCDAVVVGLATNGAVIAELSST